MGQDEAIKGWVKHGVDLEYFPLFWGDKEPFQPKLDRLTSRIDALYAMNNSSIVLIGASAGASAVINAYMKRKDRIARVVYICGKIQNPEGINKSYYETNPAFRDSMEMLKGNLAKLSDADKAKILSVIPLYDNLVPVADTKIEGVREIKMPIVGHTIGIAFSITVGKKKIIGVL